LQHIVVVFIDAQVFFDEIGRPHPECPGQPLNVILVEYRTCGLTAIGTQEAGGFPENFLMELVERLVHSPGVSFPQ
jgi:hypothetical protein